jgi:hypothetical protein
VAAARGNIGIIRAFFDAGRIGVEETQARIAMEEASIRALMDTELEVDFRTIENVIEAGEAPRTVSVLGGLPPLPRPAGEPELIVKVQPPAPDLGPWAPPESDPEVEK